VELLAKARMAVVESEVDAVSEEVMPELVAAS